MDVLRHDGFEFEVVDGGRADGRRVVLLHGFPGGTSTWDALAPRFTAAGCRTLALHQRGYSPAARPSSVGAYRTDRLVNDVVALIERTGGGPVCVVGHDWGGVLTWHLAASRPDLVESIVVLSTPHPRAFARSLLTSAQALRSSYVAAIQAPVLPEAWLLARDASPLRRSLEAGGLSPSWAHRYTTAMREPGRLRAALNWYRAAVRHPTLERVPDVDQPTTYVWSSKDPAIGRPAAQRTGRYVDGAYRFVVLGGCTHWIPELHADEVWPAMQEHLARTG